MALNLGYIEATCADGDVTVRIYYDATFEPVGDGQPLIDGPRGYCLDMTNRTGRLTTLTVAGLGAIKIQKGDPVTGGPPQGRSQRPTTRGRHRSGASANSTAPSVTGVWIAAGVWGVFTVAAVGFLWWHAVRSPMETGDLSTLDEWDGVGDCPDDMTP